MRAAFVGRDSELSSLAEYLEAALDGHPSVVLCRGEPGIGKTRLAQELAALAAERGVPTSWGVGVEGDGAPPYWPWRQVLRGVERVVEIADAHGLTADLARLDPDRFGAVGDGPASAEDRFRQFDAVARLLPHSAPLVVILDDAHWADRPSLLLLQHLARTIRSEALLVMVNYRDTEHEHADLFADLLREPLTRQIDLAGLSLAAVAEQLASVVGRDVALADAEQVRALTGGNPFFVGEVGRVLPAGKVAGALAPVTANIREAIRGRLHRLSPDAVRLVHAASIAGREFPLALVAAIVRRPAVDCLVLLDEAGAAGLVEPTATPDQHQFVHALVRDAIEATLPTPDRIALHRSAAEAIEAMYAGSLESRLSELARHWSIAAVDGGEAKASRWNELAGDQAMRTLAYEDAARLYQAALTLGEPDVDDERRCSLLLSLARAQNGFLDVAGCIATSLRAADLAERMGRADLMAESALIRDAIGPTTSERDTQRLCERALAMVDDAELALRARLLARHTEASVYTAWVTSHGSEEYERAAATSDEALTLAERSNDPAAIKAALRARQMARSGPDGLAERSQLAERMLSLAVRTGDAHAEMWAHLWHIDAAFMRGDLRRVGRELEDLSRCVERVRGPHARYELTKCRGVLAQAEGRFSEAIRLAEDAFALLVTTGDAIGFHERAGLLHQIGLHIGHDASGSLEASGFAGVTVFEQQLPTAGVIIAIANAHMLATLGRREEAAAVYRSLGPPARWVPSPHAILPALGFGLSLAILLGLDDDVAVFRERLAEFRGHHVVSGAGQVAYFGPVELLLGRAAARLGRLDEAVTDLDGAAEICAANGAAGYEVEAQCELASVLVRMSQTARARELLHIVRRRAAGLGMGPFVTRAGELLDDLSAAGPLTPRELEVAGLVAEGLTNREIAERLVLSERTAQNHVQHVLTKLGLANRSQIATWVSRREMSTRAE